MNRRQAARQRGAIGVLGALTLTLVLLFAVVAIDGGRLWYAKRHLQQVADIAAMSAANRIGCDGSENPDILAAAQAAAVANGYSGDLAALPNLVAVGRVETNGAGLREFSQGGASGGYAVRVLATETLPTSLVAPLLLDGDTQFAAEAVALSQQPIAAFSVGSSLVSLSDTGLLNQLLSGLLGSPVELTLVGYTGLVNARLSIQDLINVGLDVATPEEAADAVVDIGSFLTLVANAVDNAGTASADAVLAARQIALLAIPGQDIRLGDVIHLDGATGQAPLQGQVNVFDLITASLMLANKGHSLSLTATVPGVTTPSGITLQITEPPQLAIGMPGKKADGTACTVAKTAQIRLNVPLKTDLNLLIAAIKIDLAVNVEVAQSSAELAAVDVGLSDTQVAIDTTPGIAAVKITKSSGTGNGTISISLLGIPLDLVTLAADIPIANPEPTELDFVVDYPVPAGDLGLKQSVSASVGASLEHGLSNALTLDVLGLPLGSLLTPVLDLLGDIVGGLVQGIIDPLLGLLGVNVGNADVFLHRIEGKPAGLLVI